MVFSGSFNFIVNIWLLKSSSGKWSELTQINPRIEQIFKSKKPQGFQNFKESSLKQTWLLMISKNQIVTFYVFNNNFFYSQVAFGDIYVCRKNLIFSSESSWLESSSLEYFFVWIFSKISSSEFLHQNQKKFLHHK